jgi:DNA polymerase III epsilon subunit-like protein
LSVARYENPSRNLWQNSVESIYSLCVAQSTWIVQKQQRNVAKRVANECVDSFLFESVCTCKPLNVRMRFIAVDTETTGFEKPLPIEIAA